MRAESFCLLLGLAVAAVSAAADGDLDDGFGDGGQVTIPRPPGGGFSGIPTGDIALAINDAYLWLAPLANGHLWVGRSNHDGAPDSAFGPDGNGRIELQSCVDSSAARLVATADGGAVIWTGACLLRVDAQGDMDPSFGGKIASASGFKAGALIGAGGNRFLLAGTKNQIWTIYRFDADGALDPSFDNDGMVQIPIPDAYDIRELPAVALRDDGRIVLAGSRSNTAGPNLVIAQRLPNGAPDPSWSDDGLVDLAASGNFSGIQASALAIDDDGSVIVSGRGNAGSTGCCLLLARFDQTGALVPGFGLRLFELGSSVSLHPFAELREGVALLDGGRILMVTAAFPLSSPPFTHRTQYTLVRTHADGTLDAEFGDAGWISYPIADPEQAGQSGDYNFLHGFGYDGASVLLLGRTVFEDSLLNIHYTSFVRVEMQGDAIFANGFDG